jgi:hypothetical protein
MEIAAAAAQLMDAKKTAVPATPANAAAKAASIAKKIVLVTLHVMTAFVMTALLKKKSFFTAAGATEHQ